MFPNSGYEIFVIKFAHKGGSPSHKHCIVSRLKGFVSITFISSAITLLVNFDTCPLPFFPRSYRPLCTTTEDFLYLNGIYSHHGTKAEEPKVTELKPS